MAVTTKRKANKAKKIPPPGRKMAKQEARDFVFKTHAKAMALLARH